MGYHALRPGQSGTLVGVNDSSHEAFVAIAATAYTDVGCGEYYSRDLLEVRLVVAGVPIAGHDLATAAVVDGHGRLIVQAAARQREHVELQVEQQLSAKAIVLADAEGLAGGHGATVMPTSDLRTGSDEWLVNGKTFENDAGELVLQLRIVHDDGLGTVVTMLMIDERGDLVAFSTADTEKQAWKAAKAAMHSRDIDVPFEN